MATNNFHNVNATRIFACLGSFESPVLDDDGEETEETEYRSPDEWECENFIDVLVDDLKSNLGYSNPTTKDVSELRSFPSTILADKTISKDYGDTYVEITITSILRSGYYDGANLDWQIGIAVGGNEYDHTIEENDIAEEFGYHGEMNVGMAKIQSVNAFNWIEKTKAELVEELEKVYTSVTQPLVKVAQFSNGEAVYEKA